MNGVSPVFRFSAICQKAAGEAKRQRQPQTKAMRRPFLLLTYALE